MKNWYIVQSHSSFENKVAGLIKEEAEKAKIAEKFEENYCSNSQMLQKLKEEKEFKEKKNISQVMF